MGSEEGGRVGGMIDRYVTGVHEPRDPKSISDGKNFGGLGRFFWEIWDFGRKSFGQLKNFWDLGREIEILEKTNLGV